MVHVDQVTNLMEQMMSVNIFRSPEKRKMLEDEGKTFLDPNVVMDTRHGMARDSLCPRARLSTSSSVSTETRKSMTQEEAMRRYTMEQQRYLERELKKFEAELSKARPKFLQSYKCSRMNLPPSDDENFWGTSARAKSKATVEVREPRRCDFELTEDTLPNPVDRSPKVEDRVSSEAGTCRVPCVGSIKVTIKDKTYIDADADRPRVLRKYFDILKRNAVERRRSRETETTIRLKVAASLTRKYFDAWRWRATEARGGRAREEGEISEEGRIEMFISAITERQRELMKSRKSKPEGGDPRVVKESKDTNEKKRSICRHVVVEPPAQSRLNAQKKIIEKQRAKLAEQNRIIEEFKLLHMQREISKANRETLDAAEDTLDRCGANTRRSLIQLMRRNGYRDESLMVRTRTLEPPKFLSRMEARAEARRERTKMLEESRREKLEEQRRREDAARKEEEEKRRRLQQEATIEARKLRRAQEEHRRREVEKFERLNRRADEFYRKYLLRRYIMRPFVALIKEKRTVMQRVEDAYRGNLVRKIFVRWKTEARARGDVKAGIAVSFCNRNLMIGTFKRWKEVTKEASAKYQVAIDFWDMKLLDKCLKRWMRGVVESKVEFAEKARVVDVIYEKKLKANYFGKWKRYVAIAGDIEESERRKDELRQLVQTVIPDFNPERRGVISGDENQTAIMRSK